MKADRDRGEFGTWLRRVRLARFKNVPLAVQALLKEAGHGIAPSVWAELESGTRRPSDDHRQWLTEFFGGTGPEEEAASGDLASLIAALSSQTAALNRLADRLEAQASPDTAAVVTAAVESTVRVLAQQGRLAAPREPAARSSPG